MKIDTKNLQHLEYSISTCRYHWYSNVKVQIPDSLHKSLSDLASRDGISIDSLSLLSERLRQRDATRTETLRERQKANILTVEETTELAGITELDRIFTLMNARIIAES
jgi:hypothetical protein